MPSAKPFAAISNLAYGGLPASVGRPNEENSFETQEQAVAWLRGLGCGGSISTHRDGDFRVVQEIPPG